MKGVDTMCPAEASTDRAAVEIATLDAQGVIVAVNDAWEGFSRANGGHPAGTGVGVSYLEVCDRAAGHPVADEVGRALRRALRGELTTGARIEIACHSPSAEQWYALVVTSLLDDDGVCVGATVALTPTAPGPHEQLPPPARAGGPVTAFDALAAAIAGATSLTEVYQALAETALLVVDGDAAGVSVLDESGESIMTVAAAGATADRLLGIRQPRDRCLTGAVLATGRSALVERVDEDERVWRPAVLVGQVGSTLSVRIGSSTTQPAVVGVNRGYRREPFTAADLATLESFLGRAESLVVLATRLFRTDGTPPAVAARFTTERPSILPPPVVPARGTPPPAASVAELADLADRRILGMIDSAPDGLVMTDDRGAILLVNRQLEVMFGFDRGELLGRPIEDLLPERFRHRHTADRVRYRAAPTLRPMGAGLELHGRHRDGHEFPVEISLSPQVDGHGTTVIASVRDISDRVAAEARTRLISDVIAAVHDGVFMFAPDTLRYTYVNQGAVHQTGYTREELLTMTPLHLSPVHGREEFRGLIAPLLSGATGRLSFASVHRTKSGHDVPVEVALEYPEAGHHSSDRVLVAVARDISERVEAARRLTASEALFRAAFEDAPVGMALTALDEQGRRRAERVNRAWCSMLGMSADELIGTDLDLLTHPDDRDPSNAAMQEFSEGRRQSYVTEKRYRRADGSYVWALLHATLFDPTDRNRVLAHIVDVTDRRLAEAERGRHEQWLQGLLEVRTHLMGGGSVDGAVELVCTHVRALSGAELVAFGRLDRSRTMLELSAVPGPSPGATPTGIPVDDALRSGLAEQRTVVLAAEPPGVDPAAGPGIVITTPIAPEVPSALVLRRRPGEPAFADADVRLIQSFAHQASAAFLLARAQNDRQKLTLLEDRERIGRDLHDLVIQRIFAAGMRLDSLIGHVSPPLAADKIHQTVDELDLAIKELRSTIFGLSSLDTPKAVAVQLHDVVSAHDARLGFAPSLTLPENVESIPLVVVEQLLPSINEALSNVARHAHATAVRVDVHLDDQEVVVEVVDDGVGVDETRPRGHGLDNLDARAERIGGSCSVANNPDAGTTVTWRAPI